MCRLVKCLLLLWKDLSAVRKHSVVAKRRRRRHLPLRTEKGLACCQPYDDLMLGYSMSHEAYTLPSYATKLQDSEPETYSLFVAENENTQRRAPLRNESAKRRGRRLCVPESAIGRIVVLCSMCCHSEYELDKESSMGLRDCQGLVPSVLLREKNSHFFVDGQRQR
jgi:hypothetical protein